MKKNVLAVSLAVSVLGFALPASATVTIFNDVASFDAALGAIQVEDFSDAVLNTGLSFTSTNGKVVYGRFEDLVVKGSASTTFAFASAVDGLGGFFDETPNDFGQGIQFTLTFADGGTQVLSRELGHAAGDFYGVVSTEKIVSVMLGGGNGGGVGETYVLDDLRYGVAPVPEPETYAMMLAGLGLVGAAARRRRGGKSQ